VAQSINTRLPAAPPPYPPRSAPAAEQAPAADKFQPSSGIHEQTLADGSRLVTADNGMSLRDLGGNHQLQLPGHEQVLWTDDHQVVGTGPQGAFPVQSFLDDSGKEYGFGFERPDGTHVSLNTLDMSEVYQDRCHTLTQSIDATNEEYLLTRHPDASGNELANKLYLSNQGQIVSLEGNNDGLQVSRLGISFQDSNGRLSAQFPQPLAFDPQGPLAAPVAPPPPPAPAPVVRPPVPVYTAPLAFTPSPSFTPGPLPFAQTPTYAQPPQPALPDWREYLTPAAGYAAPDLGTPKNPYSLVYSDSRNRRESEHLERGWGGGCGPRPGAGGGPGDGWHHHEHW
jgi:hypothetical protein